MRMTEIDNKIKEFKKGLEIFKDERDISNIIKNKINNLEDERSNLINCSTFRIKSSDSYTKTIRMISKYFTKTMIEYKDFVLVDHNKDLHLLEFEINDPEKYLAVLLLFSQKVYIFDLYPIYNINNNTFEYSRIFKSCIIKSFCRNDNIKNDLKYSVCIYYESVDVLDHKEKISKEEL